MPRTSAGILLYRRRPDAIEVLLVHPGGPFWKNKDRGAWMIPKGEIDAGQDPLDAAVREFEEETGMRLPGPFVALATIRQKGGKIVHAWASEGDLDPDSIVSDTFTMEWPPRSGKTAEFPEVDRVGWYDLAEAKEKILPSQLPLLEELDQLLAANDAFEQE